MKKRYLTQIEPGPLNLPDRLTRAVYENMTPREWSMPESKNPESENTLFLCPLTGRPYLKTYIE